MSETLSSRPIDAVPAFIAKAPDKLLYRPAEVQEALGIKASMFFELVKTGRLEARKLGRATVIPAESLLRFVANLPKADAA